MIDDLPPLREVIRRHALSAKKSLGQNFLLDLNLTARIARAAGQWQDTVLLLAPNGSTVVLGNFVYDRGLDAGREDVEGTLKKVKELFR